MANTVSPNMGLIVPGVGTEVGPTWSNDLNASLGTLDQHSHVAGQGVLITTAAMNINADLPFNSNNATLLKTVRFSNQSSSLAGTSPNLGCVYVAANELYYNDIIGNVVKITNSGSVNATSSGISSGTATANFSGGVLVVNSNTNTPANIQVGSVLIGNNVSGSNFATVQAPSSLGANYSLTIPPTNSSGATSFLTYDTSNNMTVGPTVASLTTTLFPSGSITMFGGAAAPTGYLLCDGSAVSRTTYAALFTAISTAYGVGDGSTTFNVPDFRGIFPRGVSGSATNDPDKTSRTAVNGGNSGNNVGSLQTGQIQSHSHSITALGDFSPTGTGSLFDLTPNQTAGIVNAANLLGFSIGSTGGNETRPINLYVNFIIKT